MAQTKTASELELVTSLAAAETLGSLPSRIFYGAIPSAAYVEAMLAERYYLVIDSKKVEVYEQG